MSVSSITTASRTFEQSMNRQATENAWKSFGSFSDRFVSLCQELHDENAKFIDLNSNIYYDLGLSGTFTEHTTLVELFQTCGNMQLNKVLMVFASLVLEMKKLEEEGRRLIPAIALYGIDRENGQEGKHEEDQHSSGEDLMEVSKFLPVLYDLFCFVHRVYQVVENVTLQLEALFCSHKSMMSSPNEGGIDVIGVRFDSVLESLGNLCVTIINLDEILSSQITLKKDLISYKRIMDLVSHDLNQFGLNQEDGSKVKVLYEVCSILEREVIDSFDEDTSRGGQQHHHNPNRSFFSKVLDSILTASHSQDIVKNPVLAEQFASYLRSSFTQLENSVNPNLPQTVDSCLKKDSRIWMSLSSLFVIYIWLFKRDDKRMLKQMTDTQKKLGLFVVHLHGNVSMFPDKFIFSKIPKGMFDKKIADTFLSARSEILKNNANNISNDVKNLYNKVYVWMTSFESAFDQRRDPSISIVINLSNQMKLLQEGLEFCLNVSSMIRSHLFLHLTAGKAVSRKDLISICKLVILLKCIQVTLDRNKGSLFLFESAFAQYHSCLALKSLNAMKTRLVSQVKKYSEKKLDTISAVILCCNCFHGPIMRNERQVVSSLCLSLVASSFNEIESSKILPSFKSIELCSEIIGDIRRNCNIDFLFTSRSILYSVFFPHIKESDLINFNDIRYFFHALLDFESLVKIGMNHDQDRQQALTSKIQDEAYGSFKSEFLDKFCSDFETELRLQTHLDLKLEDQNPFKRKMQDFSTPLSCKPLRLFNRLISIKDYTQQHLNNMAYNLTTIALHDWKTYESMLNLARTRFALTFVQSQLPTQTIEQGLDVLEITRNIHVFVTKYSYNLNNQVFVEKSSDNKHLNVLLIRHVANSIQTHGYGIINTAVNLTYQFLRKKFNHFSQFLFEEHVKGRLIKDGRLFREDSSKRFPFDRADKFVKGIRRLGVSSEGLSFLDKFRILITEIGNALGFVRMLRSGALHSCSNSVNFVPELDELGDISFSALLETELGLSDSQEVATGVKNLDSVLSTLNRNLSDATDYFKLLVDVFAKTLRDTEKNPHLKNFYVVLPALTLSFVEANITAKDKMTRKNKTGAGFTEDGFTVGVAYILRLLDQFSDFESLHWFASVQDKIHQDREEAVREKNIASGDDKLTQTTSLTLKRLDVMQKEFDLLQYNLISCKILFSL